MNYKSLTLPLLAGALLLAGCQSPAPRVAAGPAAQKVVQHARAQIGSAYRYGGQTPRTGFDCSGLVFYSHRMIGQRVPRTTGQQYQATAPVARKHLQPGDLVFFRFRRSRAVSHVGIYLGKDRFVHAPSSSKQVSIADLNAPYWSKHFVRGGRFHL
ncbi:MAG: C40 family peptidase [Gammaproteobacteria bacterium]